MLSPSKTLYLLLTTGSTQEYRTLNCLHMTEKLLTGKLSIKTNKQNKQQCSPFVQKEIELIEQVELSQYLKCP